MRGQVFQLEKVTGDEAIRLSLQPQPSSSSPSTQKPDSILPCPSPAQETGVMLQPCISLISMVV